jgi:hypothetical protein
MGGSPNATAAKAIRNGCRDGHGMLCDGRTYDDHENGRMTKGDGQAIPEDGQEGPEEGQMKPKDGQMIPHHMSRV